MRKLVVFSMMACACAQAAQRNGALLLPEGRRVYVAELAGGSAAEPMREILIASLNSTGLFILTEEKDKADAILKGPADDKTYIDSFDSDKSVTGRTDGGIYSGGRSVKGGGGGYSALSGGDREAYHIRDRKHEAYAALRLVNRAGDTIWSTTQESAGSKFRSAGADVGDKVARQLSQDMDRATRVGTAIPRR